MDPSPSTGESLALKESATTIALPDFQKHISCPVNLGYSHTISFLRGQMVATTATLSSGGCREATITGAPPVRQTDNAYWALLAQNLGVEESALFSLASP